MVNCALNLKGKDHFDLDIQSEKPITFSPFSPVCVVVTEKKESLYISFYSIKLF